MTRQASLLIALLILLAPSSNASALPAQKPVDYIVLDKSAPTAKLPIYPRETTALYFASGIDKVQLSKERLFNWATDAEVLVLQPLFRASSTAKASVQNRDYDVRFEFVLAERARDAKDFVVVLTPEQLEAMGEGEAALQRQLSEMRAGYEARAAEMKKELEAKEQKIAELEQTREEEAKAARLLRARQHMGKPAQELGAIQRGPEPKSGQAYVQVWGGRPDGGDLQVRWRIHNPEPLPIHLQSVWQRKPREPDRELDAVAEAVSDKEGLITTIPPGQSGIGVAVIRDVTLNDINPMELMFATDTGRLLTAVGIEFYPLTDKEVIDRAQNEEAAGRFWIIGLGVAGFFWVPNPADKEDLKAVTMIGAGARGEYGINRLLSFWVEGMGAQSSQAEFGTVTREATIGRGSIGVMLKLGYETMTTARIGVGFEGMRLVTDGEDVSYDLEAIGAFGIGIAKRLGDKFVAGADSLVVVGKDYPGLREVVASLYLGYTWKPGPQAPRTAP